MTPKPDGRMTPLPDRKTPRALLASTPPAPAARDTPGLKAVLHGISRSEG